MQNYLVKLMCGFYFHILDIDEQLLYKKIGIMVSRMEFCLKEKYVEENMLRKVCNAIRYDNPEFFYWDAEASCIDGETITLKYRFCDTREAEVIKRKIREERIIIEKKYFDLGISSEEKILRDIHIFLVNNIKYAYEELQKPECTKWIYDIEGCLLRKRAVCLGIAQTVNYICNRLNVFSIIITGKADLNGCQVNHAWNLVRVNNTYWHMDVTSDICDAEKRGYHRFLFRDQDISKRLWRKDIYPKVE